MKQHKKPSRVLRFAVSGALLVPGLALGGCAAEEEEVHSNPGPEEEVHSNPGPESEEEPTSNPAPVESDD